MYSILHMYVMHTRSPTVAMHVQVYYSLFDSLCVLVIRTSCELPSDGLLYSILLACRTARLISPSTNGTYCTVGRMNQHRRLGATSLLCTQLCPVQWYARITQLQYKSRKSYEVNRNTQRGFQQCVFDPHCKKGMRTFTLCLYTWMRIWLFILLF